MYFNKEEQRRRAAEFAAEQLAKGAVAPAPMPVPVTKHYTNTANPINFPAATPVPSAWPFAVPTGKVSTGPVTVVKPAAKASKVKTPKKVNYSITEYKNHLGQVIQPGQKVIAITTGYSHRVTISEAVYLGNRGKSVVVEKTNQRTGSKLRRTLPSGRIYPTL